MSTNYQVLLQKFPKIQQNHLLAPHTTLKIGGPADLYYELNEVNELPELIKSAQEAQTPYFVFGGGSNLIFHDDGFRGLIIHIKANNIKVEDDTITADAGALLSQVIQTSLKNNLSGMEKLTGLPGTIGGAARGNAGAFGTETKDLLASALIYNEEKGLHEVDHAYFNFAYRSSTVKTKKGEDIVLQVRIKLKKNTQNELKQSMQETAEILRSRSGKQPSGKTTGSFFKNPNPELSAGYLLDQTGCKGLQIGKVQVSEQHANWIINLGEATQNEVIELAKVLIQRVKEKFDIMLEPEVQFVSTTGFLDIT